MSLDLLPGTGPEMLSSYGTVSCPQAERTVIGSEGALP